MTATRHYLFFAIRPDAGAAQQIGRLAAEFGARHGLTGRPVAARRLHISLNFVGKLGKPDPQVIGRAIAAVAGLNLPPFVVALDRVGTWGRGDGGRPLVMWADDGVIGVRQLHAAIHEALAPTGLVPRIEPNIEPHLTLLRDRAEAPLEFIAPVKWTVEEFVLLDSLRGEGRHEVLGRWRLFDNPPPMGAC